jgi:hypothetical protein
MIHNMNNNNNNNNNNKNSKNNYSLRIPQFKKFYQNHCSLDTKMNKLLNYLVPLYKQYNSIYQENTDSLIKNNENDIYVLRLNNLHQDIKQNQEQIYLNRLNMSNCIKNNIHLDTKKKQEYSDKLLAFYNNSDNANINNQNIDLLSNDFNNECIEPFFDTHQRLKFNVKCSNSTIPYKLTKKRVRKGIKKVNNLTKINIPLPPTNPERPEQNVITQHTKSGVNIEQLDKAYINKHNELMNVYKAYQILFNKVNKYKDDLDRVKSLSTSKLINNNTMKKMLEDQKYVMNSVSKMQDQLVNNNILKPEERVPTEPVVSHPQNMNHFNDSLKSQINGLISTKTNLNSKTKDKLMSLLRDKTSINQILDSNNGSNSSIFNINTLVSR